MMDVVLDERVEGRRDVRSQDNSLKSWPKKLTKMIGYGRKSDNCAHFVNIFCDI
jgi:hypothetical protein